MKNYVNGGYVQIDLKGLDIHNTSTSQTVTGLYKECMDAVDSGKVIVGCNGTYEGKKVSPFPVFGLVEDGVFIGTASILQVRVASDDTVTIVSLLG